jgi:hypothetical protein
MWLRLQANGRVRLEKDQNGSSECLAVANVKLKNGAWGRVFGWFEGWAMEDDGQEVNAFAPPQPLYNQQDPFCAKHERVSTGVEKRARAIAQWQTTMDLMERKCGVITKLIHLLI